MTDHPRIAALLFFACITLFALASLALSLR